MKLLAIETATENCSVALGLEGKVTEISEVIPNGHSARVHSMVRELLQVHNLGLSQLDAIAVDTGPGSFTGVRIGIGITQGLAFASGLPAVGVSSLAALAEPVKNGLVLSAIDARMGQVYWCLYDTRNGLTPLLEPAVSNPETVLALVADAAERNALCDLVIYGVGSGWKTYKDLMPTNIGSLNVKITAEIYPQARSLLSLAKSGRFEPPALLTAAYVRNNVAKKSASQSSLNN